MTQERKFELEKKYREEEEIQKGDKDLFYSMNVKKNEYAPSKLDYSCTYFHNSKIIKHDTDQQNRAEEMAINSLNKKIESQKKKALKSSKLKEKADLRSSKAIKEENDKKEKLEFLKKLQKEFTIKMPKNPK